MLVVLGLVCLVLFLVNWRMRPGQRRFRAWVAIVGGACLVGGAGAINKAIARLTDLGATVSNTATQKLVGSTITWAIALAVVLVVAYDLGLDDRIAKMRKGSGGGGFGRLSGGGAGAVNAATPWLGWLIPACLLALSGVPTQLWTASQQLLTRVGG